jgi:hypothetical protein
MKGQGAEILAGNAHNAPKRAEKIPTIKRQFINPIDVIGF